MAHQAMELLKQLPGLFSKFQSFLNPLHDCFVKAEGHQLLTFFLLINSFLTFKFLKKGTLTVSGKPLPVIIYGESSKNKYGYQEENKTIKF